MAGTILAALISGGLALIGVIITVNANTKKTEAAFQVAQAVTKTQLEELTREVREHNNFARRMPVVEQKIEDIVRRVTDLEREKGA